MATKLRWLDPAARAPQAIREACDASLQRLGVDAIDLYQIHGPDPDVPLEDTLEALDGLVKAGKVRALGASNVPAWLLAWAVAHAGPPRLGAVHQPAAAVLAGRAHGRDRAAAVLPRGRARRAPVGPARRRLPDRQVRARRAAAAWEPHGRGLRRPRGGRPPPRGRAQLPRRRRGARDRAGARRDDPAGGDRLAARDRGRDRADHRRAHATSSSRALLPAADLALTPEERARLERHAPPPETYPQRMLIEQSGLPDRISLPLRRGP